MSLVLQIVMYEVRREERSRRSGSRDGRRASRTGKRGNRGSKIFIHFVPRPSHLGLSCSDPTSATLTETPLRIFSSCGSMKLRQTPSGDRMIIRPVSFRLLCDVGFRQRLMALSPFSAKPTGWCLAQLSFFRRPFYLTVSPGADSQFHPSDERFTPLSTGWARSNTHSFPRGKPPTRFTLE